MRRKPLACKLESGIQKVLKMRYSAQSFVKQVQVDLLALSDDDLLHTIDQWGSGNELSGFSSDAQEAAWFALGYRRISTEAENLSYPSEVEPETCEHWIAPSPSHLRKLLIEMDVKQFTQHVIGLAFHSLHAAHPEWGDGSTFNAHLANHLRQISTPPPRRRDDLRTKNSR